MGERGPIPKRSDQRRRRNAPDAPTDIAAGALEVEVPEADEAWHEIARAWYDSLAESGQSRFYEPSDWRFAAFVAQLMTQALDSGRLNGQLITAVMSGMTELLTTEGARRRARLELERGEAAGDPDAERADAVLLELRAQRSG